MMIEMEEKGSLCPEGKLLLKNGTILDCFMKASQPAIIRRGAEAINTTDEFLKVKGGPKKKMIKPDSEPWEVLFFKEAFFLYEHKDQILADSRMFLTPLPFKNNLAYTGTSGLQNATLGIYLEWWDACEQAVIYNKDRIEALTYFIAGSPLSGGNHCSAVDRKGKSRTVQFAPFTEIWSSFMRINQRYTEAKQIYQAYTLEETISKLREA